jgi:biotin transporter BioY
MDLAMVLAKPFLMRTRMKDYLKNFLSSLIGLFVLYLAGAGYAYLIFNIHLDKGFTMVHILGMTVLPFILFDILKCVIASLISSRLSYIFQR